jgi:hypothetical protein
MNKRFVSFDWVINHKLRDNDNSYVSSKNIKHIVKRCIESRFQILFE